MRWLTLGLGLLGGLMGLALFVAYRMMSAHLSGDDFQISLGDQLGSFLGGEARFTAFEWDGWDVSVDEFLFQGEDGLQNLSVRGVGASVDRLAVWRGTYRLEDMRLDEVDFIGDFRKDALGKQSETMLPLRSKLARDQFSGFQEKFLPENLELMEFEVAQLNGRALTDDGVWSWRGAKLGVRAGIFKKNVEVELKGGEVVTPLSLVDRLTLKEAKGRVSDDQFYLLSSQFDALGSSQVTMEGDFGLKSRMWSLHGELKGAQVEELVSESWKKRLTGPLEVGFSIRGRPDFEARIKGEVVIRDAILTALTVLDRLAVYSKDSRFRRLELSEVQFSFEKIGTHLELSHIVFASEGLMRLEGNMRLNGDVIRQGDFSIGISPDLLAHIPSAEAKVFQLKRRGLLWTSMTVGGTLEDPEEDLSERLIVAAGERLFEQTLDTGPFSLKLENSDRNFSTSSFIEPEVEVHEETRENFSELFGSSIEKRQ